MQACNAQVLLDFERTSLGLSDFKSRLSVHVLLVVATTGGVCELRKLFKLMDATAVSLRLHVQSLDDEGYMELYAHETNRRCKMLRLTDKGWALMREYERRCQLALSAWQQPKTVA